MTDPAPAIRDIRTRISSDEAGVRLDIWLSRRFTYMSRHQWQKVITEGRILLNERPIRASRLLNAGDEVLFFPPENKAEPDIDPFFQIVAECPDFLIVNKSGNLPCHPAGAYFNHTLWMLLRPRYPDLHVVTRLDRETSGLVLCALGENRGKLAQILNESETQKRYYALVHGRFDREMEAKGYLSKDPISPVMKKRRFTFAEPSETESEGIETAETLLRPIAVSPRYSLVEAVPKTGRLHQIRATLCSLGFPLVGDKIYGINDHFYLKMISDQLSALDRKMLEMPRQALHASTLTFRNPETNLVCSFAIPLPGDMLSCCQSHELILPPECYP